MLSLLPSLSSPVLALPPSLPPRRFAPGRQLAAIVPDLDSAWGEDWSGGDDDDDDDEGSKGVEWVGRGSFSERSGRNGIDGERGVPPLISSEPWFKAERKAGIPTLRGPQVSS